MYLNRNNSNSFVLEIGSGIGTIAHLVLKNTNLNYLAYETNDFCIKQLKQNVNSEKLACINSFNDLLQNESLGEVSFLIIDDLIDKKRLKLLLLKIKPKYIFIEGHRFSTRKDLVSIISENYANKYF
jgi:phospholipid N-methyltransferase